MNTPNKIIVHHTASPRDSTTFLQVDEWHKARAFSQSSMGWYVGYHYLILGDGRVIQARADWEAGCHTVGQNWQSIGICLTGNFDYQLPSTEQENALGALMQLLLDRYQIPMDQIFPHRNFQPKDCYGTLLKNDWAEKVAMGVRISNLQKIILELKKKIGLIKK